MRRGRAGARMIDSSTRRMPPCTMVRGRRRRWRGRAVVDKHAFRRARRNRRSIASRSRSRGGRGRRGGGFRRAHMHVAAFRGRSGGVSDRQLGGATGGITKTLARGRRSGGTLERGGTFRRRSGKAHALATARRGGPRKMMRG